MATSLLRDYAGILTYDMLARPAAALMTFLLLLGFFRFILPFILRNAAGIARRTKGDVDDILVSFFLRIPFSFYLLLSFLASLHLLPLSSAVRFAVGGASFTVLTVLGIALLQRIIEALLASRLPRLRVGGERMLPPVLRVIIVTVLWGVGFILVLSNLGVNVISLVTGLGIGGIAVALAAQNILGDMFSSFVIFFDQPFKEGDFIIVGQHMGTVKNIGIKTTRIQALQGEEVIISNQELTNARVQNFQRMRERRIQFRFGVTYDTPRAKLSEVPALIRDAVEKAEPTRFDRAHFASFGDSSLDFEVVYFVLSPDYNVYRDVQQAINLGIVERFEAAGISFAFPTRTLHMASSPEARNQSPPRGGGEPPGGAGDSAA